MANEINSVGGVQNQIDTRKQTEIQKQEQSKINIEFPKGQEQAKPADFNAYGKDIANFEKFKGNDKNDAMRMTNSAANDVKKAYMQLQHEFPGIILQFEAMPDPTKCGKKREGFFNYQQQLDDWKDLAMTQIANAREQSTKEIAGDIMMNDNRNAAMNAGFTLATGEAIIDNDNKNAEEINANVDREGAATRKAVHNEGAATRNVVRQEGTRTRQEVQLQGAMTRNLVRQESTRTRQTIHDESTETRNLVREEEASTRNTVNNRAQETQELESLSSKVSDVLTNGHQPHTTETVKEVGSMRDEIMQSNLPHDEKKELLNDLANFSDQTILNKRELKQKRQEIEERLKYDSGRPFETPGRELPEIEPFPAHEAPDFIMKTPKKKPEVKVKEPVKFPEPPHGLPVDKDKTDEIIDKFK